MPPRVAVRPVGFRPAEISALVNVPVVKAHASEAAFLATLRSKAVALPSYRLKHLHKLDSRVVAHLEGLRLARDKAWAAAQEALSDVEEGSLFVAGFVAFECDEPRRMNHVVQLALTQPELESALVSALSWLPVAAIRGPLERLNASTHPEHRRIALAALAAHRRVGSDEIVRAANDADPRLRGIALRAAAEMRREDCLRLCRTAIGDADGVCRFWAGSALAFHGHRPGAVAVLENGLLLPGLARLAIEIALRCGEPRWARDVVRGWTGDANTVRNAILGVGALGDPVAVPWLIHRMSDAQHARVAGEALSTITGVDLKYSDLVADADEDAVIHHDDAELPLPDVDRVREWWQDNRAGFGAGVRHLAGKPITPATSRETLRDGFQRQRLAAAIELMRSESTPMFPLVARADWQLRWLAE